VIDTQALTLSLARAGHPAPLRLSADGALDAIEADGSLLGIFAGEAFSETIVQLAPGDRVFFFTDGVEVAFSHDRTMDMQCWQEQILSRRSLPSAALVNDLNAGLHGTHLRDDLTMIVMDVN
jgi:serine phosphatase RsbU (regulator of sigma subunit)